MFERIGRSWELMRQAWNVLREDTGLVVFPILSGICSLLVMASFVIPAIVLAPWRQMESSPEHGTSAHVHFGPWGYALTFLYYLATYFVVVFFNSALVACVRM